MKYKEDIDEDIMSACEGCEEIHTCKDAPDLKNTEIQISPECHPGVPLYVMYKNGALHITCAICNTSILNIKVASKKIDDAMVVIEIGGKNGYH